MALGAMDAWTAQASADYAALSTGLCLCVCAAGLFGEGLVQRGIAKTWWSGRTSLPTRVLKPEASPEPSVPPERVVARNLSRLTASGLVVLVDDAAHPALRSYRLAT